MDQITKIKELVVPILAKDNLQLYDVSWHNEGNSRILQIAIMHADGTMDIDTCVSVSEKISEILDEKEVIASEYFLEVCSPGAERELRNDVQIQDAIGEYIYVKLKNPKAGVDEIKGTLTAFENNIVYMDYYAKAVKKKAEIEKDNIGLIRLSVKI
ncbi:MAG: ribosome maturation factor RimP [Longicatena sp.]